MQLDFHYYATYCAAFLAGYSHDDSVTIAYSAQFVDCCSKTFLDRIGGPAGAATTQLQLELMEMKINPLTLREITRIWTAFHFLPFDLYATKKGCMKAYLDKYRLICDTNSDLLVETVNLARGGSLQAAGIAMHVLADTWAHRYFAGVPSLVINNINYYFYELLPDEETGRLKERPLSFSHNPTQEDSIEKDRYVSTLYQTSEQSVMNLGHGRAGHLPDYSFMRYKYMPAWGEFREVIKDNPSEYLHAFGQMIYGLKYLRGQTESFEKEHYDWEAVEPWRDKIVSILEKRQLNACQDWKEFGESLSGQEIEDFDMDRYAEEYIAASEEKKNDTFLGSFILAAMAQKVMVSGAIIESGNYHAGLPRDLNRTLFSRKGKKSDKNSRQEKGDVHDKDSED